MGLAAVYLGLSLFVTYMRDRDKIRDALWGNLTLSVEWKALFQSYGSRIDQLMSTFSQPEFFSINNDEHLKPIDERLNLSAQVGRSVHYS